MVKESDGSLSGRGKEGLISDVGDKPLPACLPVGRPAGEARRSEVRKGRLALMGG